MFRVTKPKPPKYKTLADCVSTKMGSWTFIGGQAVAIILWLTLNTFTPLKWDKSPFVLLNLMLSFQAAFTGPVLLMAANRQAEVDRQRDIDHYLIDMHDSQVIGDMAAQVEDLHKQVEVFDEEHY